MVTILALAKRLAKHLTASVEAEAAVQQAT
jgi:hypothetical protein